MHAKTGLAIFFFAVLASLSLTRCGGDAGADPVISEVTNLIRVPLARQAENYTCGVAALQSVLGFYGEDIRQGDLARDLGSTEQDGTSYRRMLGYAERRGFEAQAMNNMALEDLKALVDQRLPVIILIQAWRDGTTDWRTDENDGHYVVAVGYDVTNFYFMDPSTLGHYTYIPIVEFQERWHDVDKDGTRLEHFAMLLTKRNASYNPDDITRLE